MLIPPHLPGHRTARERFDATVTDAAAQLIERYPRRLQHLRVLVQEIPTTDPAPWEEHAAVLGRALPGTRDNPPRVVLHRLPIQTRCPRGEGLEILIRQVLAEQVGSLLGIAAEDVDPGAWEE